MNSGMPYSPPKVPPSCAVTMATRRKWQWGCGQGTLSPPGHMGMGFQQLWEALEGAKNTWEAGRWGGLSSLHWRFRWPGLLWCLDLGCSQSCVGWPGFPP